MVGPDADAGPGLSPELERYVAHGAEAAHADLRESEPRLKPAVDFDCRIDHPRTVVQPARSDAQLACVFFHGVRDLRGRRVQVRWRQSRVHARISPAPSSARSPL